MSDETVEKQDDDVNVEIKDFRKVFRESGGDEIVAVDDLNLEIKDGEFLVFVGPSGCGKTTTLRSIAGLETPTEGSIWIDGQDVTGLDPRQRGVAMVFQNYALYPHMTVRENMSFPLRIRNYPDDEIEDRVEYAADLLSIPELLDRKPSALSGGQQQRVALGRAIVREPSVFLMDEPLSNLDAKLRVEMRTELNEIHQRVEKTTIYVTHNQAEAMTLGDRVAVLNDGELQQVGPPQHLYDNPKNRFVAGFIGEPPMSFFHVEVEERDEGYWARSTEEMFDIRLPDEMVAELDAKGTLDGEYTLGIRPEDMYDSTLGDIEATDGNMIHATVKIVEPMGSDKFLTLIPEGGDGPEFTARVSPESEPTSGAQIDLAVNTAKMHLFDLETGRNLSH